MEPIKELERSCVKVKLMESFPSFSHVIVRKFQPVFLCASAFDAKDAFSVKR